MRGRGHAWLSRGVTDESGHGWGMKGIKPLTSLLEVSRELSSDPLGGKDLGECDPLSRSWRALARHGRLYFAVRRGQLEAVGPATALRLSLVDGSSAQRGAPG